MVTLLGQNVDSHQLLVLFSIKCLSKRKTILFIISPVINSQCMSLFSDVIQETNPKWVFLELIVLVGEFPRRYEAVFIFILIFEDILYHRLMVCVIRGISMFLKFFLQVLFYLQHRQNDNRKAVRKNIYLYTQWKEKPFTRISHLLSAELPVVIEIHLPERLMRPGTISNVHELNVKNENTAWGNLACKQRKRV